MSKALISERTFNSEIILLNSSNTGVDKVFTFKSLQSKVNEKIPLSISFNENAVN